MTNNQSILNLNINKIKLGKNKKNIKSIMECVDVNST